MKKLCLAFLMLTLAIVGGTHLGLAQDLQEKNSDDVIASMLRDGWTIKQDGVLQRDRGPHQTESFVFGSAGFTWKLQDLQKQLRNLRQAYLAHPKPELRKAILNHRKEIANTQKMIVLARADEDSSKSTIDRVDKASCNISFGYSASASYLTSQQGTTANASANFSGNCGFTGEVYAYSYSEATVSGALTTQTLTDGPRSGSSVTATANTSQTGLPSCDSYAYASMTSSDFSSSHSSYSISATNYNCPAPVTPPVPTITGPSSIYVTSGCATTTWTASATNGTSPYTYQWTWNGANVATGTSYSRSTCAGTTYSNTTNTLGLTVTDSASRTGNSSKSVVEEKAPATTPLGLTFTVSPTSSSTAPIHLYDSDCVTVTWTATASGGTTPYTRTIYVSNASVGNVATYSRMYCNTGTNLLQTIPAYATVTDGAGTSKTSTTVNTYIQNHKVITEPTCGQYAC